MNKARQKIEANDAEVYCTTREAADLLHVSLRTVQLWVESGVLKAWKTDGGHRRLPLSSVKELIQERMNKTDAVPPLAVRTDGAFSILVLESDENTLKRYRLTMTSWQMPIRLTFVGNVFEALLAIGRTPPDLLVTDLRIPGINGFEIIRLLRNDPLLRQLNIVVVTGMEAHEIEAHGGLPNDITQFSKPISFEQLQGYVKACLAHRRQTDRQAR